jgi:hypothetical protein
MPARDILLHHVHQQLHPDQTRWGILVQGLPQTSKYDKLLSVLGRREDYVRLGKAYHGPAKTLWGPAIPIKTTLFYEEIHDGPVVKKRTTGEAIFIFEEECDVTLLAIHANGKRLDKSHTLSAATIKVCRVCLIDTFVPCSPGGHNPDAVCVSPLNEDYCCDCFDARFDVRCCVCLNHVDKADTHGLGKYTYCTECCDGEMVAQEKWRQSIPVYDTISSYDIKDHLYLSHEAIEREKEIHGGSAPLPDESMRPFQITPFICDLIDPTSQYYWPYGQSGYDYMVSQEEMRFNNPTSETPVSGWQDIYVTEEMIHDSVNKMNALKAKYQFCSLREPGSIPTKLTKDDMCYRLIPTIHGFTCDSPMCQAINHLNDYGEASQSDAYNAFILTGIPIYTSRTGNLHEDDVSKWSYGREYCLSCMMPK